jgi:hypothetical protein
LYQEDREKTEEALQVWEEESQELKEQVAKLKE